MWRASGASRFSPKRSSGLSLVKWLTMTMVPPGMQTRRISAAKRAGSGTTEAT